jgi:hypothetical protein
MLSGAAAGILAAALPCLAQEKPEPLPERPAQEKAAPVPEQLPPIVEIQSVPGVHGCDCPAPPWKALWVEREVPLQTLVPREVIREEKQKTLEVLYREEKRTFTEVVIKPREIQRQVTHCRMQPVTVTDPCTGHCTTVMQPVTEVKQVKETIYEAAPEKKEVTVRVPYLKEVDVLVPAKTLLLEQRTEMRIEGYGVKVPAERIPKDRVLVAPAPCCPHEQVAPGAEKSGEPVTPAR